MDIRYITNLNGIFIEIYPNDMQKNEIHNYCKSMELNKENIETLKSCGVNEELIKGDLIYVVYRQIYQNCFKEYIPRTLNMFKSISHRLIALQNVKKGNYDLKYLNNNKLMSLPFNRYNFIDIVKEEKVDDMYHMELLYYDFLFCCYCIYKFETDNNNLGVLKEKISVGNTSDFTSVALYRVIWNGRQNYRNKSKIC